MAIESFPDHPLSGDDVKAIGQQDGVEQVYGMLIGDVTTEEYGFDVNIGLNVGDSLDHDFFFDLVIDTGSTIAVAAYPRPDLPAAEELGPVDDPRVPVTQEGGEWAWIYRDPKPETAIADVVAALKGYRDFSSDEQLWVDSLGQSGIIDFITD